MDAPAQRSASIFSSYWTTYMSLTACRAMPCRPPGAPCRGFLRQFALVTMRLQADDGKQFIHRIMDVDPSLALIPLGTQNNR